MDTQIPAVVALCKFDRLLRKTAMSCTSSGGTLTSDQKRALDRELAARAALCAKLGLDPNKSFG